MSGSLNKGKLGGFGSIELLSAQETLDLGRSIGAELESGVVIGLDGDLGAGKTTLVKGIFEGLGYKEEVTSPTFSLVQEYVGGRMAGFHFDFYRIESAQELLDLGWDDYLDRGGVLIAEWAQNFEELFPKSAFRLRLEHCERGRRVVSV